MIRRASLVLSVVHALALMLAAFPRLSAQIPDQSLEIHRVGPGTVLEFQSLVGRTYFLQVSGGLAPPGTGPALQSWAWAPVIEVGTGDFISYEFGGTAPRGFARLQYTDEPVPPGVSPDDWDADGDGLSNAEEIDGLPQSDPLLFSSSGTGISDGWARAHGLNPNDPAIAGQPFGGGSGGPTNLEAWQMGVQAHPEATPDDRDGDGLADADDADPLDRVIDWSPGPRPAFGIIELGVAEVDEGLYLDDFTENGTVLLSRSEDGAPAGRIVVDRNQIVHPFPHGGPSAGPDGSFAGYGPVLVEDAVPGFRLVGGFSQECLWDPADDSVTPWDSPVNYHDSLRDERDGMTLGFGWFPAMDNILRRSPDGEPLPGGAAHAQNGAWDARIEGNGNIVSDWAYWRWNGQTQDFDDPALLPGWSRCRSATLVRPAQNESPAHEWNLVAGTDGLMASKDKGAFKKAAGGGVSGVSRQGWIWKIEAGVSGIRANGEWRALTDWLGDPEITEAELWDLLDTGLAVARIKRGESPAKLALLVPFEIGGHKRGTVESPGAPVPGRASEYGQETVMLENGDSESAEASTGPDYKQTGNLDAYRRSHDDDLVKVVLRWPKGIRIAGAKLELKHSGLEVDPAGTTDAGKYKETGASRLNFYKPDGTRLTANDLKIDDLSNPGNGYLAGILATGELELFIEGGEKFGVVEPYLEPVTDHHPNLAQGRIAAQKMGGAMLNLEFTNDGATTRTRLLVYRGGFLRFVMPQTNTPLPAGGVLGTLEFRDGKGRVSATETDLGEVLYSWAARSGRRRGAAYNVRGRGGHAPPGWYLTYRRTAFTGGQNNRPSGSGLEQGSYVRWKQDDEVDPDNRYTTNYVYNPSLAKDNAIGPPDSIQFKWQMETIPPTDPAGRSDLQIHPDGEKNGTDGCIGIQSHADCEAVLSVLGQFASLKLLVQITN